jgi:Response regulators consisting of a CheY-like receiver domain and a winged-helix DNA-binding domain
MRILVIEDEVRIQAFLARGLEAEGYTVAAAGDGREGLDLATDARWDLVVLDLLLPGLNGLQVLRELQRAKPELPVVILSARGDVQTKVRGFELGGHRLRREAVLARRAARADPGPAARFRPVRRRARPSGRQRRARRGATAGTRRRAVVGSLRP